MYPFNGTGLELVTKPATIRYLEHSATSATKKPLKTRRERVRCMLNLSRLKRPRWCGVKVWRRRCQLRYRLRHLIVVQNEEVHHQMPSSR
ncbi:hypothetical protein TNCV_2948641 [Trichonephila clavipes]|nr:hypothetical protein TNCV_2948641 [Trichonephila clavipes]